MSEVNQTVSEQSPKFGAITIETFYREYGIPRSRAFVELKSGRLPFRKCGRATLIDRADAERWLANLPKFEGRNGVAA